MRDLTMKIVEKRGLPHYFEKLWHANTKVMNGYNKMVKVWFFFAALSLLFCCWMSSRIHWNQTTNVTSKSPKGCVKLGTETGSGKCLVVQFDNTYQLFHSCSFEQCHSLLIESLETHEKEERKLLFSQAIKDINFSDTNAWGHAM